LTGVGFAQPRKKLLASALMMSTPPPSGSKCLRGSSVKFRGDAQREARADRVVHLTDGRIDQSLQGRAA